MAKAKRAPKTSRTTKSAAKADETPASAPKTGESWFACESYTLSIDENKSLTMDINVGLDHECHVDSRNNTDFEFMREILSVVADVFPDPDFEVQIGPKKLLSKIQQKEAQEDDSIGQ
jgi:hypothetical protein